MRHCLVWRFQRLKESRVSPPDLVLCKRLLISTSSTLTARRLLGFRCLQRGRLKGCCVQLGLLHPGPGTIRSRSSIAARSVFVRHTHVVSLSVRSDFSAEHGDVRGRAVVASSAFFAAAPGVSFFRWNCGRAVVASSAFFAAAPGVSFFRWNLVVAPRSSVYAAPRSSVYAAP